MCLPIQIPTDQLAKFCQDHHIKHLSLFRSVLRDDFGPANDVVVLVEFQPGANMGLIALARLEIQLSQIFGFPVENHRIKGLNPLFRDEVLRSAEVQYEPATCDCLRI